MARGAARRRGAFWFIAAAGRRRRAFVGLRGRAARGAASVGRAAAARALASVFVVFLRLSFSVFYGSLRFPRLRFAGAERGSRDSQGPLHIHHDRVRATKHAPRDPFSVLERRHGLAEIVE